MLEAMTIGEMLLRAGLAVAMGVCIGWNRELHHKAAGVRTMALVSLGAAGMMMAAVEVVALVDDGGSRMDVLRVASGVIGGIGFLGAGSIIQSRGTVHGMTTAASIWSSAAVGIACGLGLLRLATVLFVMVMLVLVVLSLFKAKVLPERDPAT
ncbi:MAG: MgtC/SapB family protein [Phycisphaerales bacterium]